MAGSSRDHQNPHAEAPAAVTVSASGIGAVVIAELPGVSPWTAGAPWTRVFAITTAVCVLLSALFDVAAYFNDVRGIPLYALAIASLGPALINGTVMALVIRGVRQEDLRPVTIEVRGRELMLMVGHHTEVVDLKEVIRVEVVDSKVFPLMFLGEMVELHMEFKDRKPWRSGFGRKRATLDGIVAFVNQQIARVA